MNKIALITDLHFGVKNDNPVWLEEQVKYYEGFINDLKSECIETVIMLGDVFDRRKYSNHETVNIMKNALFDPLMFANIQVYIIVGNHDCYYRNTNLLNAPDLFLSEYSNIIIVSEPQTVMVEDTNILMLPWINELNHDNTMKLIAKPNAEICMGHLEVAGFEMYKGMGVCHNGLSQKLFKKFKHVFSGHFHQGSKQGNIQYLGAPMQFTWADYDCDRGFYFFDLETQELSHVINPDDMFVKLYYDNVPLDEIDYSLDNKVVRLIVAQKDDQEAYEKFVETLTEHNKMFDFSVIDNTSFSFDGSEISAQALADEDTMKITESYIESMPEESVLDGDRLKEMFNKIHNEALE